MQPCQHTTWSQQQVTLLQSMLFQEDIDTINTSVPRFPSCIFVTAAGFLPSTGRRHVGAHCHPLMESDDCP